MWGRGVQGGGRRGGGREGLVREGLKGFSFALPAPGFLGIHSVQFTGLVSDCVCLALWDKVHARSFLRSLPLPNSPCLSCAVHSFSKHCTEHLRGRALF